MELPFRSKNPYNSQLSKIFDFETSENIAGKIDLADQMAKKWKKKSFGERALLFNGLAEILDKKAEELAMMITQEMGKPI